jgi:hypothetical protein
VQLGARLSRSETVYFRHNDMADLARHLQRVRTQDEQIVDDSLLQRRFIVVEGLYSHHGDLCPLPEVLRLAREYQWRVILDDSCGIRKLGRARAPSSWILPAVAPHDPVDTRGEARPMRVVGPLAGAGASSLMGTASAGAAISLRSRPQSAW